MHDLGGQVDQGLALGGRGREAVTLGDARGGSGAGGGMGSAVVSPSAGAVGLLEQAARHRDRALLGDTAAHQGVRDAALVVRELALATLLSERGGVHRAPIGTDSEIVLE